MKLLVVDDNDTNLKLLSRFLGKWGFESVLCSSGEEAVEYCRSHTPHLILMDIMMPGINGQEAARRIKALNGKRHIPIIYVTALKEDQALAESLEAGGDDFVTKPIDKEILGSKIRAHLRIRELNHELEQKNEQLRLHNYRLEREHELVNHFFERQERLCDLEPSHLKYHTSAASAFNGDMLFAKRRPAGGANLILGDFTGHGLTAAMGTLPVSEIFMRMTAEDAPLHEIAGELNRCLYDLLPSEIFLAATLIQLQPDGHRMSVWAGGLPSAYLLRRDGAVEQIDSGHLPLGVVDGSRFDAGVVHIDVEWGDRLYFYTDGLVEAVGSEGRAFGEDTLIHLLENGGDHVIDKVRATVMNFMGPEKQDDDISLAELTVSAIAPEQARYGASMRQPSNVVYPFNIELKVDAQAMRSHNSLDGLAQMLASNQLLRPNQGVLYTIISELYTNALEHGILGLDSSGKRDDQSYLDYYNAKEQALATLSQGKIEMSCRLCDDGQRVIIRVRHDGPGGHRKVPLNDEKAIHGWGLSIVAQLCESLKYLDEGRCVEVTYNTGADLRDARANRAST